MGVAYTLALTQDRAFHLWVLSKPLPTMVKTASLALGEIPSVPETGLALICSLRFPGMTCLISLMGFGFALVPWAPRGPFHALRRGHRRGMQQS
jgi:hypothetical protein